MILVYLIDNNLKFDFRNEFFYLFEFLVNVVVLLEFIVSNQCIYVYTIFL